MAQQHDAYGFQRPAAQRSVQKDGAAEAVDLLLATLWP